MARMFLIPLLLALGWWAFLLYFRIPLKQGAKGFYWIIGIGGGLDGFGLFAAAAPARSTGLRTRSRADRCEDPGAQLPLAARMLGFGRGSRVGRTRALVLLAQQDRRPPHLCSGLAGPWLGARWRAL